MASDNGVEISEPEEGPRKAPAIYNWTSVNGAAIATVGLTITVFFIVIDAFDAEVTGYAGLKLLPPMLLVAIGLALILGGWIRERRRKRRGEHSRFISFWVVDPFRFVRKTGPWVLLLGTALVTLGLVATGVGSMAAVEFSESNTFCSDVCHAVMAPEATAYQTTAHSRVPCVECHVGAGAEGFLQAKIGGMRQLWAVATNSVERPIETPIDSETIGRKLCENCHSLEREIGYKAFNRHYYLSGMEDSPAELAMVAKVGGPTEGLISGGGIHYHMMIAKKFEFIARDPQAQDIAWIRVTGPDGSVREYENEGVPLTAEEKATLEPRILDCVDCHSRPAHAFRSPTDLVNAALLSKRLPDDLYYIKEAGVRALDGDYESVEQAMTGIETSLRTYYEEEDPDVLEERAEDLAGATDVLQAIYRRSIFPEMKANWKTHPNNIGHRDSLGCFRCHNDEMVDQDGNAVFKDCNGCHAVLAQDEQAIHTASEYDVGMGFAHPQDGAFIKKFSFCSDCHTGGKELYE